jgi:hypothetical protein
MHMMYMHTHTCTPPNPHMHTNANTHTHTIQLSTGLDWHPVGWDKLHLIRQSILAVGWMHVWQMSMALTQCQRLLWFLGVHPAGSRWHALWLWCWCSCGRVSSCFSPLHSHQQVTINTCLVCTTHSGCSRVTENGFMCRTVRVIVPTVVTLCCLP